MENAAETRALLFLAAFARPVRFPAALNYQTPYPFVTKPFLSPTPFLSRLLSLPVYLFSSLAGPFAVPKTSAAAARVESSHARSSRKAWAPLSSHSALSHKHTASCSILKKL
ncbi:hypothetical protein QQF64_019305 [Cirrhinus molitorella]|uniref:Secreted protein n=1 Tax=Cirrhinus molitorella TaxID=172907 RepID=A0ABR3LF30_9TELE